MRIFITAAIGLLIVGAASQRSVCAEDRRNEKDKCTMLYTDGEARSLIKAAEKAVPAGKFLPKNAVLKALGIDPKRLCNRQVHQYNLGYLVRWQLSESFDVTWGAAVQDPTPLERDDRKIAHVRIIKRSELFPPMVDEKRPQAPAKVEAKDNAAPTLKSVTPR